MKKLFSMIGLVGIQLVVGQQHLQAQTCSQKASADAVKQMAVLKGRWQGNIEVDGKQQPLAFHVSEQDGQIMASIAKGSAGLSGVTAQASLCAAGKYHFFGKLASGEEFRYNASLKEDRLEGNLTTGNSCSKEAKQAFFLSRSSSRGIK